MNDAILSDQVIAADEPSWFAGLDSVARAALLSQWRKAARQAWALCDPAQKCEAVFAIGARVKEGSPDLRADLLACSQPDSPASSNAESPSRSNAGSPEQVRILDEARPGRPLRPQLVEPAQLAQRSMGSEQGKAALLHAIAHIEFNAVNLALDAVWRFEQMPAQFYLDWLSVAVDEARHFRMIERLMQARGHAYGDFDAHDGLWEMAERTREDVLERMALVPRVMEARGLDATPPIQAKLRQAADHVAADALDVILREEVRHVALGNKWFSHLCAQRGVEPCAFFREVMRKHRAPRLRGRINIEARIAAGFTESELIALVKSND